MRTYFAYIRVSTVKQGEKGSSLTEQRDAIDRYATKQGLIISEWFEEKETAAKIGRTVFRRVITRLKKGNAHGLIMHKIDRGARNLADWAELAALMDLGADVHFAHEAIDMQSRGGRLSADIQAVVASDYIRNLRQEVKKGINGRLKQGLLPFCAPAGYLNNGGGAVKTIDPVQGPLVRQAFSLYAEGKYSMRGLVVKMNRQGLRGQTGRPLSRSALAKMLDNPFYYGLIRVTGITYPGIHQPLISKSLFDQVRARAEGRTTAPTRQKSRVELSFRRMIRCSVCNHYLYGENQKGFTYYRCQSLSCKGTSLREEAFLAAMADPLQYLSLTPALPKILADLYSFAGDTRASQQAETVKTLRLRVGQVDMREERLTDVFINGGLDNDSYQRRRTALQNERLSLKGEIESAQNTGLGDSREAQFLELVKALQNMPHSENSHDLRDFVKMAVSNLSVQQKTIDIKWSNALAMLIDLSGVSCGAPELTTSRKCSHNVTTNAKAFEKLLIENAVRIVEAIRTDDALDREPTSSQHTPSLPHVASKNLGNLRCRADMV